VLSRQVATATCNQKVQAELKDADSNVKSTSLLDGVQKESLYLEDDSTKKTIIWGPFDEQMTVELTFSHKNPDTDDWDPSSLNVDKMKEVSKFCRPSRSVHMTRCGSIPVTTFKRRFHWYSIRSV
jgi:hypothetical protein